MVSRSELRYACYRVKNNTATPAHMQLVKPIEEQFTHHTWDQFGDSWDVLVESGGNIILIKPETDYDFIHATCLQQQLHVQYNVSPTTNSNWTTRKQNVITIVENIMLDGVMSWENYNSGWGIEIDRERKMIKTKLFNVSSGQRDITPEMLNPPPPEVQAPVVVPEVVLEVQPMDEQQISAFSSLLHKRTSKKKKE